MPLILGGIVMWSGAVENIPEGWALCDGTNGTLDLRNRFILGAGDTFTVGDTGGFLNATLVTHNHAATTTTIGNHSHSIPRGGSSSSQTGGMPSASQASSAAGTGGAGSHSHTLTVPNQGVSATNANLPPYYALAFIQQIE